MKRIFAFLLSAFCFVLCSSAADLQLVWDASTTPGVEYRIYATTNKTDAVNFRTDALVTIDVGTNLTATVKDITPGMWTFVATSIKKTVSANAIVGQPNTVTNSAESGPSNFLFLEVPQGPAMMRTLVMQADFTLTGTNWIDAGFFKLGIK